MKYKHLAIFLLFMIWIINGYFVFTTEYGENEVPLEGVSFVFLSFGILVFITDFFYRHWDKPIKNTRL